MLSKYNTTKAGYFYRILALPVVLFFVAAFTIKTKAGIESIMNPANKITVVIDAGHGGSDAGATGLDGSHEKDINLAFVKRIKELNQTPNIELVFTRETDIYQSPQEKAAIAKKMGADLFISVHASSEPFSTAAKNGMEIFVSNDEHANSKASKLFASSLIAHFKNNYGIAVPPLPMQRKIGVYVLQANECPSILIETGYVSNRQDLAYLQTNKAKDDFAKNLLNAIAQYADNLKSEVYVAPILSSKKDTVPPAKSKMGLYKGEEIKKIEVSKDCEIVQLNLASGKTIYMSMTEAKKQHINLPQLKGSDQNTFSWDLNNDKTYNIDASERLTITGEKISSQNNNQGNERLRITGQNIGFQVNANGNKNIQPLVILDGKEIPYAEMNTINPNNIESVNVLKGEGAIKKYGAEKSINGVIEIQTKNINNGIKYKPGIAIIEHVIDSPSIQGDKILLKVQNEAEFPGGKDAWSKYLMKNLNPGMPVDEGWSEGTFKVIVRFVVSKDGSISNVVAENYNGSKTAQMCVDFIKNGPKWIPGRQNNLVVNSYKKQPITFVVEEQ